MARGGGGGKRSARATPLQRGASGRLVSRRSKTGDPQCSAAMSAVVNARHGNPVGMALAAAHKILGGCRSKARALKQASQHEAAGNTLKAQVLRTRAAKGVTGKADRSARAKELVSQLHARRASATAKATQSEDAIRARWRELQAQKPTRAPLGEGRERNTGPGPLVYAGTDKEGLATYVPSSLLKSHQNAPSPAPAPPPATPPRSLRQQVMALRERKGVDKPAIRAQVLAHLRVRREMGGISAAEVKRMDDDKYNAVRQKVMAKGLPELKGSEKQVPWANKIRYEHAITLRQVTKAGANKYKTASPEQRAAMKPIFKASRSVLNQKESRYWIDNRTTATEQLVKAAMARPPITTAKRSIPADESAKARDLVERLRRKRRGN